jgi:hypothetical protein
MSPTLIKLGKWLVTAILVPMIEKWVTAYIRARKKVQEIGKKGEANERSAQEYTANPSADTFNKLP